MKYENMPCPVCGSHMHEGDDIIICPDCGTPCHRECWKTTGHCINESKHGEGFVFTVAPRESLSDASPDEESFDDIIPCHICGSENPVTSRNCNHCGALLNHNKNGDTICPICKEKVEQGEILCPNCGASLLPASVAPLKAYNPFNGNDPDEKLGDNSVGEVASYLRFNQAKYIKKFHNIENHEKINFNWSAFFFGPFWFLFRKMFFCGLALLMTLACTSLIILPGAEQAYDILNESTPEINKYLSVINGSTTETTTAADAKASTEAETSTEVETSTEAETSAETETSAEAETTVAETETKISVEEATDKAIKLQTELYSKLFSIIGKPLMTYFAIILVINILCGFYADGLYYKKIKKDLETVKEEVPDNRVRIMLISRRGGVSILNVICGFFAYSFFQSLAATIAEYIANTL